MEQIDNKLYDELVKTISSNHLADTLGWMAIHGSSVLLNWGEDDNLWECSWISSGLRFTAFEPTPINAVRNVLNQVRNEILTRFAQ